MAPLIMASCTFAWVVYVMVRGSVWASATSLLRHSSVFQRCTLLLVRFCAQHAFSRCWAEGTMMETRGFGGVSHGKFAYAVCL